MVVTLPWSHNVALGHDRVTWKDCAPRSVMATYAKVAAAARCLIAPEERYLTAKFGAQYQTYAASVRRWIGWA